MDNERLPYNDEEFNNFMMKVNEVNFVIQELRMGNPDTVDGAMKHADKLINENADKEKFIDENKPLVETTNRTIINKEAFKDPPDQETMSVDGFKRSVEIDCKKRAEDRRQRKETSDRFKILGNKAFRNENYNKALNYFNQAIESTKDSALLYENRALTHIKLGLYQKALKDCDSILYLNETSLKGLIYLAHCQYILGELREYKQTLIKAHKIHPQHEQIIDDYTAQWLNVEENS